QWTKKCHPTFIRVYPRDSRADPSSYPPARVASNVPCFEGLSPTRGENSTSPVIKSGVSNFPLNTNVPASRPTLPSINSIGPEKVTKFPSPRLHFASEGFAAPQTFALGSSSSKMPFPAPCASNRSVRCSSFANVISTFHLPIKFVNCFWAMKQHHVFTNNV